jgi:N-sulfoglucosamine sulfohydrolase
MRLFHVLFLLAGLWAYSCTSPDKTSNVERPNIILYLVDDLGTNDAGCYGNPVIRTPALDALASEGTRFSHAYCSSPSCAASRSTILTGLHNHANGQYGHSHFEYHFSAFDFIKSLPVILDSAGYRTMRVGKLHVAPPRSVFRFGDYMPKMSDYPDKVWKHFDEAPFYPHSAADISPAQYAEDLQEFLTDESDTPFFLYFCTWDPHHPFRREGSDSIHAEDVIVPAHLPDIPEIRQELALYYMSTQRADKGLQRLTEILKEAGKWENTLVIFTSDNGRPFVGAKANLWDPGIQLPFVVKEPNPTVKGIVTDAMISFADITPTILDYAGVDATGYRFHGRSFRSQVPLEKSQGFDTVFASHTFHEIQQYYPMRMIRTREYKLIWNLEYEKTFPLGLGSRNFPDFIKRNELEVLGKRPLENFLKRPQFELYHMVSDPDEIRNLAYDPEYAHILESLRERLFRFQDETGDIWSLYRHYGEVRELLTE